MEVLNQSEFSFTAFQIWYNKTSLFPVAIWLYSNYFGEAFLCFYTSLKRDALSIPHSLWSNVFKNSAGVLHSKIRYDFTSGLCKNHIFNRFFWNNFYADMILSKNHQHNSICSKNIFMHHQMHMTVSVQYMHAMERIYFCFSSKWKNFPVPPMVNTNQNQNQKHVGGNET